MGERTQIEWTDATWNPTTGCTKVSAGCDNCYAHTLAHNRLADVYRRKLPIVQTPEAEADPFAVRIWPERLKQPEKWSDARMIFVNSMSDLFHNDIPEEYLRNIFEVMLRVDRHVYQVLTKRPARAQKFYQRHADLFARRPMPEHIWLGTSVEHNDVAYRVRQLRDVPAEIRFLSCEPLLGPLTLDLTGLHWVIVGGESGVGYRAMQPEWATEVRDQCVNAGVPFFFKQWGGRTPKAKGRLLEGRTWDELPLALHELTV
jgi:protein gp37